MKIAIVGGGAAGLITAYLLQDTCDVHVFEKQDILGGNVRTLNGNVSADGLDPSVRIENGVLGFHVKSYPTMHRLIDHLGVEARIKQPRASLYNNGQFFPANPSELLNLRALFKLSVKSGYASNLSRLVKGYSETMRRIVRYDFTNDVPVGERFGDYEIVNEFVQSLLHLAFSTPYPQAQNLPISLTSPYLRSLSAVDWTALKGGAYAYIETILKTNGFQVSTGVSDLKIKREESGVTVSAEGSTQRFDKAVIATTPGQVLNVLSDPDVYESAWFALMQDHAFKTTAHTDEAMYKPYGKTRRTPMDLFRNAEGKLDGYNTYMNGFYDLPSKTPYSFAYGLDELIAPEKVLSVANHTVPTYTVDMMGVRKEIQRHNGYRNIYYAGAYLGNGLHEGAATSALDVSRHLNGKKI